MLVRTLAAVLFLSTSALAGGPLARKDVPKPLEPWTQWALWDQEQSLCPFFHGTGATRCAWPSRLELSLDDKAGRFTQAWRIDVDAWVPLPGDDKRWPQEVKVNGQGAVVAPRGGVPSVYLSKGDHQVTGSFAWDSVPESVQIPPETALLQLSVRGAAVALPNRDDQGKVWLQKAATQEEGEKLELIVHRKVSDDIPLLLTTRIQLNVAGKNREVVLGKALPAGFVPMSLSSALPARVEPDSRLRVQVRPGQWTLELQARSEGPVTQLSRPKPEGPWREGEEVWVFESKNELRQVNVEGVSAIDPQQTALSDDWKRLPAYPMKLEDTMTLAEQRRGDSDPAPDQLSLQRALWLDFAGTGYTVSDTLTGTLNRAWRLEMAAPTQLGRVAIGGRDQFITRLDEAGKAPIAGVEVRQGQVSVKADSRLGGDVDISDIPAVGWNHDFHQVSAVLHLPAGWRLFHASGVDYVPETWLKHWSLLELFLALIISLAVGRLFGWPFGGLALVTCALIFPEEAAPKYAFLAVLAGEALVRVLPAGKVQGVFKLYRLGALAVLALISVSFLVQHVREGMYPALERPYQQMGGETLREEPDRFISVNAPAAASPEADYDGRSMLQKQVSQSADALAGDSERSKSWKKASYLNAQEYDPNAMVQTGPGLPRWSWNQVELRWSGPVERTQRLHLVLLPPWLNGALAFLRAGLLAALLLALMKFPGGFWPKGLKARFAPAGAALLALLLLPSSARAEELPATPVPEQTVLDALRDRLLRKPECSPACASSPRMSLEVSPKTLRARIEYSAAVPTAVPLPGSATTFLPSQVLLDGQPAKALVQTSDGQLWLSLPAGSHQVVLEGPLPARETVQLPLPLKPHRVEAKAEGWALEGLHEDGLADDNLQLTRKRTDQGGEAASLQAGALPPFVRVERTVAIGLNWQAETRVVRLSPLGSAVVLEVPLLAGESVTTADVRVVGGKALVNMAPQASEVTWRSVLEQTSPVKLAAPKSLSWTEVWRLDVGPIWHVALSGIPVVHQHNSEGARLPEWRPWPGEEAEVVVSRPAGVPGQTLTVDHSLLEVQPGLRATDVTLTLSLRSSRGAQHVLPLPEDAVLQSVTINGTVQPIRQDKQKVTLPLSPGAQEVRLAWRQSRGISVDFGAPVVDLGLPSVNSETHLTVPDDRWLLFAGGPRMGPKVLFWSLFLVLLLVAAGLGRIKMAPLKSWQWVLLMVGLSQVPVVAAGVVAGWLIFLGWRKEKGGELKSVIAFDFLQLALVAVTVVALVILGVSIHQGLLGTPEMQVQGNGSSNGALRWFQDRSESALPSPWFISVPMLVYRGAMLAWALWLALSVLRWLKWGWGAFTTGGAWRVTPRIVPPQKG
jgi:hypothetical protein